MPNKQCGDQNLLFLRARGVLSRRFEQGASLEDSIYVLSTLAFYLFMMTMGIKPDDQNVTQETIDEINKERREVRKFTGLCTLYIFLLGLSLTLTRKFLEKLTKSSHPALVASLLSDESPEFAEKFMWDIISNSKIEIYRTKQIYSVQELTAGINAHDALKIIQELQVYDIHPFFEILFKLNHSRSVQNKFVPGLPDSLVKKVIAYLDIDDLNLHTNKEKIEHLNNLIRKDIKREIKLKYPDSKALIAGYEAFVKRFHPSCSTTAILDCDLEAQNTLRTALLANT